MVYFNLTDRTAPKGLQIAKYGGRPLLSIDEDFAMIRHYGIEFKVDGIEVHRNLFFCFCFSVSCTLVVFICYDGVLL